MAVRAHDVAFGDLALDGLPTPSPDKLRDVLDLVSLMIELEHERVAFAAVDARMGEQVRQETLDVVGPDPLVAGLHHGVDALLVTAVVRGVATATAPLSPVGRRRPAVEAVEWLPESAGGTHLPTDDARVIEEAHVAPLFRRNSRQP
jgi:hypothetical protein